MGEVRSLGKDPNWKPPLPRTVQQQYQYKNGWKETTTKDQTAIKCLVELKVAGFEIPKDLDYAIWWWMRKSLEGFLGVMDGGDKNEKPKGEVKV